MSFSPILSIILPVFNGEAFLKRTIQSVRNQDLENWELIVVNDGSTDQSETIISDFCTLDSRIIKISQENKGLSAARNAGFRKANGKYVVFLDADDYVEEDYYNTLVASTEKSGADFVVSSYIRDFVQKKDQIVSEVIKFQELHLKSLEAQKKYCDEMFFYNIYIHVWNKIYRRDFLNKNKILFDESIRYAEDVPYNIEVLKCADDILFLDIPGYHYICHQSVRLTGQWKEQLLDDNCRVYRQITMFEQEKWGISNPWVAAGMYLRSCFLSLEKAFSIRMSYHKTISVINDILGRKETSECLKILKNECPSKEFWVYKTVLNKRNPHLFYSAAVLRKGVKRLLKRS